MTKRGQITILSERVAKLSEERPWKLIPTSEIIDIFRGRLCGVKMRRRLLMIITLAIVIAAVFQCFSLPYRKKWSVSSQADEGSVILLTSNASLSNKLRPRPVDNTNFSDLDEVGDENVGVDRDMNYNFSSNESRHTELTVVALDKSLMSENDASVYDSPVRVSAGDIRHGNLELEQAEKFENMKADTGFTFDVTRVAELQLKINVSVALNNYSRDGISALIKATQPTSISQMNDLLLQSFVSSHYVRLQRSSARDRELLLAKLKIENAPIVRSSTGLHASAFRNISMFKRSYELMERLLKVYVYKEGEKPIFHQSKMRGIYASEGWFLKHIEGSKKFVVKDPRKAHLFFLPFSPQMLRTFLFGQKHQSQKDLEGYLKNYVDLVAQKYSFWNRTGGADHFLVGCHDWASRITRQHMKNCIRVLCNANVAKGFKIGKDTTLPVTYIRSAENPIKDVGGKPPSERSMLAFFAGGMHGYLRPILVQFWENKESDMKIFGPMPRDIEGKRLYREYMKSSKYCVCARGYEVHTPRIVESIFYECVPVIISDNYVPPFFEVLNWDAFAVFVQEKDVPNLRNILLSIPEEKYRAMQFMVKMVQQHFLWHKNPVKYDLFHMILHSVWHNRIFQMKM
ncbi:probable glycosyltransferase At3g07620 [Mercurialis annua]|uniref:probable glycosyltransferase At3g07620 n=1 Tax=Mercurialis annua TaxID=3986 RepID=UPI00215E7EAC|nr:probable glycosyltransferase At3g07620 [Mercurialis annua]